MEPEVVGAWTKPTLKGSAPAARGGHSTVLADYQMIIFGGHYYGGSSAFEYLNDTHVLDVETSTWHNVRCGGEIPEPRYGHSSIALGSKMFVFGGRGKDGEHFKDMYFLDLLEWTWSKVNATSSGPSARASAGVTKVGNKMVLFGGWDSKEVFDDMWVFDTAAFTWITPEVSGKPPCARYGLSLDLTADGRIVVFGGTSVNKETGLPEYYNDYRELDTETMEWAKPRTTGDYPQGRFGQSLCCMNGKAFVFGGWSGGGRNTEVRNIADSVKEADYFNALDSQNMVWENPKFWGYPPAAMYGHTCTVVGSNLFLFGGWDGNQPSGNLYVLEMEGGTEGGNVE